MNDLREEIVRTQRILLIQRPLLKKMGIDVDKFGVYSLIGNLNGRDWTEQEGIACQYGKLFGLLLANEIIESEVKNESNKEH